MHDNNCKQEKIKNQMKCFSWPENIKDTNRDCLPLILVFLKAFRGALFSLFSLDFSRLYSQVQMIRLSINKCIFVHCDNAALKPFSRSFRSESLLDVQKKHFAEK